MSMHDGLSSLVATGTMGACAAMAVEPMPEEDWKLLELATSEYDDPPLPPSTDSTGPTSQMDCEEDDDLLIERVCANDRQAFEALYYRFAPRIGRYLHKLLRQREAVEEVVNDVLLAVWQNAERFDPEKGRLSTWLFGIAHNKALKHLERSRKHRVATAPVNEETDGAEIYEPQAPGSPDGAVSHRQLAGVLRQALAQLSADHRAVVELTYFEDYSYQEIADVVECPVNTVKTRMFHARRRLADILGDAGSQHLEQVREE